MRQNFNQNNTPEASSRGSLQAADPDLNDAVKLRRWAKEASAVSPHFCSHEWSVRNCEQCS